LFIPFLANKIAVKKERNAGNEGSQVEFEQIVQTVSPSCKLISGLGISTLFLTFTFAGLKVQWSTDLFATTANGESNPLKQAPQYPVYLLVPLSNR
jgi:hypothetical protein